jgi:hypothetical protein
MQRKFEVIKPYYFLAKGTILKQDISGNYFVSMSDDGFLTCRIHGDVRVEGGVVENMKRNFREILPNNACSGQEPA